MTMVVGLTGGVASGKSLVEGEFKRLGAMIIDADVVAREITAPGKPAYKKIVREFGKKILLPDGQINRKILGTLVFSDPEKLKKLNEITHPPIIREIKKLSLELKKKYPQSIIVVNAPLLIEVGLHKKMNKVVVVYADENISVERIKKRDGLTKEEALSRIKTQMPLEKKIEFADFVIYNNGDKEDTLKEARDVWKRLEKCP